MPRSASKPQPGLAGGQCPGSHRPRLGRAGARAGPEVHISAGVGQTKGKERKEESPGEGPLSSDPHRRGAAPCPTGNRTRRGRDGAQLPRPTAGPVGQGGRRGGRLSSTGPARTISTWLTGEWSAAESCPGGTRAGGPRPRMSCAQPSWGQQMRGSHLRSVASSSSWRQCCPWCCTQRAQNVCRSC